MRIRRTRQTGLRPAQSLGRTRGRYTGASRPPNLRILVAISIVTLFAAVQIEVEPIAAGLGRSSAGPRIYLDSTSDAPNPPNLTSAAIVDDASGRLTLDVSFANRRGLLPNDVLVVGLDVDNDRRTGGPMGMDYALSATTTGAELGVWDSSFCCGAGYVAVPGAAEMSVAGHSVLLSTTVDRLGALATFPRPRLRLVLIAIADTDQPDQSQADDVAGPWTYKLAGTRSQPRLGKTRPINVGASRRASHTRVTN